MKLLLIFIFVIINCFSPVHTEAYCEEIPYNIVVYNGEVKHFFTHELIYSTQKAFSHSNNLRYCFDRDHFTVYEFRNFLEQMRLNDYVLVDFDMMYDIKDGNVIKKTLFIPAGKKPFTLSLDDMSYDTNNRGIINKIIVENDTIKDYTQGEDIPITEDRESITILENYLKKYPEFSVNNSKMCICVNGYNGVLGYRIQKNNPDRDKEIEELKVVVNKLKSLGYTFASHSYSHAFINSVSSEFVSFDLKRWHEEIESVIGGSDIFCFPGGIHNVNSYNDRIIRQNFKILLCVGVDYNKPYEISDNYVYIYRTPLDGNSLRTYPNMYREIFEPDSIYDNEGRFIGYFNF